MLMACGQFQFPDASSLCNNKPDTRKHDVTLHESQVYVNVSRNQAKALSTKACRGEQISGYQKISTSDMMGKILNYGFCGRRPARRARQQQQQTP
jgi:hypothetical protein